MITVRKDNFITRNYLPNNDVHEMKSTPKKYLLHFIRDVLAIMGGVWVFIFVCGFIMWLKGG